MLIMFLVLSNALSSTHPGKICLDQDKCLKVIHLQKTSSRRIQDVLVKTNILVLVVSLQEVCNTLSWRYPGKSQDFMTSRAKVLVFHFTAPLVAAYRGVFRTWWNIYDGDFLRKYLTALSCWPFLQKAPSQMFEWVENRFLASG